MNIGLIGCGRVSELHMSAYKNIPEANVIAVSDVNLARANTFAQKYRIKTIFDDYSKLLNMKELDFVDICTPTSTHATIACDAAESNHNILMEKPMARSTQECDKIIEAVTKHDVKFCLGHNQIFIPYVMQMKAKIDSGEFPISHFRVLVRESAELIGAPKWIMTPEQGGVLWETGTHAAYLQLHFLKGIHEVSAVGAKIENPVYDHFVAFLNASNKTTGTIEISWLSKKLEVIFELIGTDGQHVQILNYNYLSEYHKTNPGSFLQGLWWDEKLVWKKWINSLLANIRDRRILSCLPQYVLINKYMNSIKNDTPSPVTLQDGRDTVKLLECIDESLKTCRPIQMTPSPS
jgi:predicted dehydrogenase